MPMPLNQLLAQAESSVLIRELTLDSRAVKAGDLFLAVPGLHSDGRNFITDAVKRGAAAVAYEAEGAPVMRDSACTLLPIRGLAGQLSMIAGRFYGEPSRALRLIGITGTNGKTSISQLLAQALERLGEPCGVIGTLGNGFPGHLQASGHTTPDALGVQSTLAELKQQGAKAVAMEVSSHGLDQGRVSALDFDVAVFSNLSRDHLDYHGTLEAYGAAKAQLFAWDSLKARVINLDDAFGRALAAQPGARLIGYSLSDESATLYCRSIQFSDQGVVAQLITSQGEGLLRSPLLGRFNLSNLLAVVGALLALNYPLDEVLALLPQLTPPPGRMQRLGGEGKPLLVVDYAHTPDALEQVLTALRPHVQGRLLCLFGCGGDRDRGKRPLMAEVAERLADGVLVTDDNPRTEDPEQIFADIRQGVHDVQTVRFMHGRGAAIAQLIGEAQPGDLVLLAGKGHEDYQEICGQRSHFSDLEQAQQALALWQVPDAE